MDTKAHKGRSRILLPGERLVAGPHELVPGYGRLRAFFPIAGDLARALGVRPATVSAWSRGTTSRTWRRSLGRIELLLALCEEIAPMLPGEALVGRWLLAPHPFFAGESPARALIDGGEYAYDQIIQLTGRAPEVEERREQFARDAFGSGDIPPDLLNAIYGSARSK